MYNRWRPCPPTHRRRSTAIEASAGQQEPVRSVGVHSGENGPVQPGRTDVVRGTGGAVQPGRAPSRAGTAREGEPGNCNACGQVFTADPPETAGPDKYDATAVAMIALLKYGTGVPFNRLESLEQQLGMPLPATTQWELMEAAAKLIRPVLEELIRQAAQGSVMHNDDTGMRILRLAREPGDKRTGTFTSAVVSIVGTWRIALYFTGWKHAGENIAEVLKRRARELPAPIQMCDALSRNTPKLEGVEILLANCLAHGMILWAPAFQLTIVPSRSSVKMAYSLTASIINRNRCSPSR
jgi:Transposase IS66 family